MTHEPGLRPTLPARLAGASLARLLMLAAACCLLASCVAYRELQRQEKVNYAVINDIRRQLAVLEQERSVLLAERSRLPAQLAEARKSQPRSSGGSSSRKSSSVAHLESQLQQTEQKIASNAAEIERAKALAVIAR